MAGPPMAGPPRLRWPGRWPRLGLRDRVAVAFGLMALLLSALLGTASFALVSRYVQRQHERAAVTQATSHAALLASRLKQPQVDPESEVDSLRYSSGTSALLEINGRAYPTPRSEAARLPEALLRSVRDGATVRRVVTIDGTHYLAVGVPLGNGDAFFEIFPRTDLEDTLDALWLVILVAAAATTAVGAVLGRVTSHRLLKPLGDLTAAAAAFARGDLTVRLDPAVDPDLVGLATSFNATAEALQERVRADARFAGDIGHELRTPLTTMLNSMQVLENRREELPPTLREPLELLAQDLERFRRFALDLLEISRDDGGDEPRREEIVAAELVRRAADSAAGRPVTCALPEARAVVLVGDKRRLERVVTNLVDNAERHGGGCTAVSVSADDTRLTVCVDDAGPGVPPERRATIFERFSRDKGAAERDGVGLGLAIVARHVRWHGGSVRVEESPQGGARFVVELPLTPGVLAAGV